MRLTQKLTTWIGAVVLLSSLVSGTLAQFHLARTLEPYEAERISWECRDRAMILSRVVESCEADVRILGAIPAAQGVLDALDSGADPRDGTKLVVWKERLASIAEAFARANPTYLQVRLIGAAEDGLELIRVNRTESGAVEVAPDAELQRKGSRPYFGATMRLPVGSIYCSPIELNEEHGRIQVPHVPVIRVATPVANAANQVAGIVIINVDMRPILASMLPDDRARRDIHVFDDDGRFLVHPDPSREFAPEFDARAEFPEVASHLKDDRDSIVQLSSSDNAGRSAAISHVDLPNGMRLTVVEVVPDDAIYAASRSARNSCWISAGLAGLLALAISAFLARTLVRPIESLTRAVEAFPGPTPLAVTSSAADEIAALERAFRRMGERVTENERIARDELAARAKAEAALVQKSDRERLLVAAIECANDAVILKSLDGVVLSWNAAAQRIYGYTAEEMVGKKIHAIVPQELHSEVEEILRRIRNGEETLNFDTRRMTRAGRVIDVSLSISPVRATSGQLIGASAIERDVTDRVAAEERFRVAVEACPSGMLIVDSKGFILLANGEATRQFGYSREELIGSSIEALVPKRFREDHTQLRETYKRSPHPRLMGSGRDLYGLRKNGTEFPIEVGLNPIAIRSGPMVMCVVSDITLRKQAQDAAARHAAELERSNRELEEFAHLASHDLQEPLRMVGSYTELIAAKYKGKLDPQADKYIQYTVEGALRMKTMITDLLAYSRISSQPGVPKPTDLNKVMDDVVGELAGSIRECEASVTWKGLPIVEMDPRQAKQLLRNLVANALKFRRPGVKPVIDVASRASGSVRTLSVADNGIGIDPSDSGRLFQMFQRLHDRASYPGNGIGLAIAKKIVENHGGRIWFESDPGKGTTFFFELRPFPGDES